MTAEAEALSADFEAEPVEKLSAGRRLTLRQRTQVEAGVHPLTGGKTHPEWGTCGDCRFRKIVQYRSGRWPKCVWTPPGWSAEDAEMKAPPRATHGSASDVRAWWPACSDFDLGDPKVSQDAARWTPEATR